MTQGTRTDISPEMETSLTGEVAEVLSKKSGVGKTNIYYLLAVKDKRPDLYEKVFDGSYSIGKAHTQMKLDENPPTTEEERQEELEANGIRDAIKCTPAFTVISGHQRLRIAKDLGLTEVPVDIIDVDEWEAEYLLIAENVERRGVAEQDAIKKARIAQFLKEYWGIKQGSRSDLVENQRSMKDVAETIGESEWSTRQILKLNKLIPQLQRLVSTGKLGTTSAYLGVRLHMKFYMTLNGV
ncbi:ParB N-terminal domain-containing protein [Lysinibacillus sp. FSL K6-0075]|uniref:ParB/RepB/Spo0J family partition protein n=1 Tax=Lysinibacillus sp. FSL K6-0075 TaxID=2921415 RepID=UPI003159657A